MTARTRSNLNMRTLDPQAKALLDTIAASDAPSYHTLSAVEARKTYKETRRFTQPATPPDVAVVEDRQIPGADGSIRVRHYRPAGSRPDDVLPALVYFHGGGFTIGDLDTHDTLCRSLANEARCAVVSVDYRMGPEHKFPAAVHDCVAATRWVFSQAAALHIDAQRIAVGGDSAGANLATVTSMILRDNGDPAPRFQLLFYPPTDMSQFTTPSHIELAEGHLLTRDVMTYFRANYAHEDDWRDWRVSPIFATRLEGLPPAYLMTAGFDPLRDEGHAYAEAMKAAGVEVDYECFDGMIHGFITMGGVIDKANEAVSRAAAVLRRALV